MDLSVPGYGKRQRCQRCLSLKKIRGKGINWKSLVEERMGVPTEQTDSRPL